MTREKKSEKNNDNDDNNNNHNEEKKKVKKLSKKKNFVKEIRDWAPQKYEKTRVRRKKVLSFTSFLYISFSSSIKAKYLYGMQEHVFQITLLWSV